jgi:stearoyl-CoA desaturase (delta-9 desaturase)
MVKNKIAFFYTYYYLHVILISWAVIAVIFGIKNFFLIWLAGTGLSLIFANSINTWHHGRIYWPGQTRVSNVDTSKNDLVMGYLGFDGWHNNHHVNPKKYYYGNKWWQLDFCGMYIWVISTVTGYKNFLRR